MEWLKEKLCLRDPEEWYGVSRKEVSWWPKGSAAMAYFGGVTQMVETVYPEYDWDTFLFSSGQFTTQMFLKRSLRHILENVIVATNASHGRFTRFHSL